MLVTQLCLTLCDHMDCSPSGCSVHEILQARILEWVANPPPGDLPNPGIKARSPVLQADSLPCEPHNSFKVKSLNCVTLCDPMDCSLPGSTGPWDFPDKNTGVSCHFLSPGDLSHPGLGSTSPTLAGGFFSTEPPRKPNVGTLWDIYVAINS